MEKLALFDENNEVIKEEFILRSNKNKVEESKRYKIVLVFIEDSNHKFLIQKVTPNKGDVYATTGGHVTYNDSSKETVVKELKEELNIDINEEEIILYNIFKYPILYADCYYLKKDIDLDKIILQEDEVESIHMLSTSEIEDLISKDLFRKSNIEPYLNLIKLLKENKINKNFTFKTIIKK